jgi:3-deoxy-D-manno-octulosonate 8-phosphate phosphatase (KDO 8-P phosphatase)
MNLKDVTAIVSDVDGVLTDGRVGMGPAPFELGAIRFFDMRDGMGTKLLQKAGVPVAWLSASIDDGVIRRRADMLGVEHVDVAVGPKEERFRDLCRKLGADPESVVYIGDDVNDLPPMRLAGFTACPADARPEVREAVDLILTAPGGRGAFRELADLILRSRPDAAEPPPSR